MNTKQERITTYLYDVSEHYSGKKRTMTYFLCGCGKISRCLKESFEKMASCGCLLQAVKDKNKSLGIKNRHLSKEYKSYTHMKDRCYNEKNPRYHRYGGRGIIICQRWLDNFDNFLLDMGLRPYGMSSIDRINNDGNYEPSNCRWSYPKQQSNNTTKNVFITYNGETRTISEWATTIGCKADYISTRLNYRNWTFDDVYKAVMAKNKQ